MGLGPSYVYIILYVHSHRGVYTRFHAEKRANLKEFRRVDGSEYSFLIRFFFRFGLVAIGIKTIFYFAQNRKIASVFLVTVFD